MESRVGVVALLEGTPSRRACRRGWWLVHGVHLRTVKHVLESSAPPERSDDGWLV